MPTQLGVYLPGYLYLPSEVRRLERDPRERDLGDSLDPVLAILPEGNLRDLGEGLAAEYNSTTAVVLADGLVECV